MARMTTRRLVLELCSPQDRTDFIRLELDLDVMRFLHNGPVDHARLDPEDAPFLMPRGTEPHVWTARHAADNAFVGWFCLYPAADCGAELGYRLQRDMWGLGFASEGAAALRDWGFEVAGYDRIMASTMTINHGSRRVMEKIGMKHARTEFLTFPDPVPGTEQGEVIYEIHRADWAGR